MKLPKIVGVRFSDGDEFMFPDSDSIQRAVITSEDEFYKEVSLIFLKTDPEMHRRHIHELREAKVIWNFEEKGEDNGR